MQIACTTCGKIIPAEDVNLDQVLAKCRGCNTVFDFSAQIRKERLPEAKLRRDRGEIPMPPQIRVERRGGSLTLTRRWGRGPGGFLLVFALLWNGITGIFLGLWIFGPLGAGHGPGASRAFLPLFFVPFVGVGIVTAWLALGFLLNRTSIEVAGRRLRIRNGPVWWTGNRDVDGATLDQLYCEQYVAYLQNNVPQYRFQIQAISKDGTRFKLVRGIEEPAQALYLEHLLEEQLGIVDRPVPGEYRVDGPG